MWQYNYSPELYHYGVMGMKWGHRKQKPYSSMTVGQKQRYIDTQHELQRQKINKQARSQKKAVVLGSGSLSDKYKQIKTINKDRDKKHDKNVIRYYKKMGKVQSNKQAAKRIAVKTALTAIGGLAVGGASIVAYKRTGDYLAADAIARIGGSIVGSVGGASVGKDVAGIIGNKFYNKKKNK